MNKVLLILICTSIFCFAPYAQAKEATLESLYGEGLYSVPMAVRVSFQSETGRTWHDVSEDERRDFLTKWTETGKKVKTDQKAYLKSINDQKKMLEAAKLDRKKKEQERARRKAAKLKAIADEKAAQDRELSALKAQRTRALQRLKQIQSH
ncbi:MAG: hypothetical protein HQL22_04230 [Candidatus Omnitrophica bacterium]|nr:hypothetical protein [Candidatus Omnitrophota bacterium]